MLVEHRHSHGGEASRTGSEARTERQAKLRGRQKRRTGVSNGLHVLLPPLVSLAALLRLVLLFLSLSMKRRKKGKRGDMKMPRLKETKSARDSARKETLRDDEDDPLKREEKRERGAVVGSAGGDGPVFYGSSPSTEELECASSYPRRQAHSADAAASRPPPGHLRSDHLPLVWLGKRRNSLSGFLPLASAREGEGRRAILLFILFRESRREGG